MSLDLAAYLRRIDHPVPTAPDLATLRSLHVAHTAAIVFENLDIQRGLGIDLDLDRVQAKLVGARRGGYCFEQNTLFSAVLEHLGYAVTRLCGRVRMGRATPEVPARTHMISRVDLAEGPYLADVGFGAGQLIEPIALVADVEIVQHGWPYVLVRHGAGYMLRARHPEGWIDLYEFTLEPQHPIDFVVANHYTSTHPASRFVTTLTAQRVTPAVRYTLRDRSFEELRPDSRVRREIAGPEELLALLGERFGLHFAPGTWFRSPDFAATAAVSAST